MNAEHERLDRASLLHWSLSAGLGHARETAHDLRLLVMLAAEVALDLALLVAVPLWFVAGALARRDWRRAQAARAHRRSELAKYDWSGRGPFDA